MMKRRRNPSFLPKARESFVGRFKVGAVACLVGISLSTSALAQDRGTVRIESSGATALVSGFERVRQIRELASGDLLVLDGRNATPLLVDLETGTSRAVSRVGDGPGEFRQPSSLIALSGDSTAVVDLHRWVVLDGARPVATLRAWLAGVYPAQLKGVDRSGRVLEIRPEKYGVQLGTRVTPTHRNAATLLALVHRRASVDNGSAVAGIVDTIAQLRGAFRGVRRHTKPSRPGRPAITYELVQELATDDQAILFPDGWIAIAYSDPYRVEWRGPNGQRVGGARLPITRVRVDEFQKRATIVRGWPADSTLFASGDYPPWPDVLPPFLPEALLPSPDGSLVIRRTPDGRLPQTAYDLVSRRGAFTGRIVLKSNKRLVAFGRNAVYVVSRDGDGIETVERHDWPPRQAK
jgi:hypothetical protein